MVFRARRLRTDAPREDHRVALPRVHRRVRGLSPAPVPPFTATRRRDERRERVRGDGSRRGRRIGGDTARRRGRGIQIVRALRTRRARPRGARGGRRAARGEDARGCRSFRDARSREDASRRASGLRGVGRVSGTTRRRVGVDPRRDRGERRGGGDDARRRDTRGGTRGGTRETFSRGSLLRARGVASSRYAGKGARGEATWRLAAEKIAEEIAAVYPAASSAIGDALGGVRTEDASFAFDAYSRATAIRAADVARAVTSRGAGENIAAEDAGEIRTRDDGEWTRDSSSRVCVGGRRGAAAGVTAVDTFLFDAMDVLERVASESSTDGDDPSAPRRRNASCDDWRAPRARARARRRRKTKRRERIRTGAAIRIWRRTTPSARSMTSRAKTPDDRARGIRERSDVGGDGRVGPRGGVCRKRESRGGSRRGATRWTLDAVRRDVRDATSALGVASRASGVCRRRREAPTRGRRGRRGTFAPRGVGTPRVGTPSSRARASRAVRHRPGRGDGRRRVSGGARGVVGGGGRQHAAAWTLSSRRRGRGGAERRGAAGDSAPRSAPSSPAVPSSPARTTRRGWRLAARLLRAECAGRTPRASAFSRSRLRRAAAAFATSRVAALRATERSPVRNPTHAGMKKTTTRWTRATPRDTCWRRRRRSRAPRRVPRRGEKKKTFESIPGDALGGDAAADAMGALETLAIAAGERLARVARAMEGEGDV